MNHVLVEVGLPQNLISLLMSCITTVETNVKLNGKSSYMFAPHRGLRQGNPLSPYPFVMGMDKLSLLISKAVDDGLWKSFHMGRHSPLISHLMFVDDFYTTKKMSFKIALLTSVT